MEQRETMNIVIVGHVDHGKSTLVGRLLADTGVLGDGKMEKVQTTCRRQGKAFEYAFLLDALEAEQQQGITIDAARVFFRTDSRDYIIIDAPGHIEFLKNMVTGAARAQAAVLLIDAKEGVRENSRRHGYLLSMLGIRQVAVVVNKMDLVDYDRDVFLRIEEEYRAFLAEVGITPSHFIPISARDGEFVASRGKTMDWYDGATVLDAVDSFAKLPSRVDAALRMPVQDVYRFNARGDERRIVAGRIEAGRLKVGERVIFSPSNKTSTTKSIEAFSAPVTTAAAAGSSVGLTLTEELFIERGEVMSHLDAEPLVGTRLRVNVFWLGRRPMTMDKRYKLKLGTAQVEVRIDKILRVLDASDLDATTEKSQVDRHDVAELIVATRNPIAFDLAETNESTGRFVIVDEYDIAGGGIVRDLVQDADHQLRLESRIRDIAWVRGDITNANRAEVAGHPASMVTLTGAAGVGKHAIACVLERVLVGSGHHAYLLDGKNVFLGVDADLALDDRAGLVRRFGEVAHLFLDSGTLVVSTTNVIGLGDHRTLQTLIAPFKMLIVHVGPEAEGLPDGADLRFDPGCDPEAAARRIASVLAERGRLRQG
ncbi:MAG: GTP-binding protein [Nannocystaceae bacterium]|nr:GTP-binding protein [Nannocystaceae bacterium]